MFVYTSKLITLVAIASLLLVSCGRKSSSQDTDSMGRERAASALSTDAKAFYKKELERFAPIVALQPEIRQLNYTKTLSPYTGHYTMFVRDPVVTWSKDTLSEADQFSGISERYKGSMNSRMFKHSREEDWMSGGSLKVKLERRGTQYNLSIENCEPWDDERLMVFREKLALGKTPNRTDVVATADTALHAMMAEDEAALKSIASERSNAREGFRTEFDIAKRFLLKWDGKLGPLRTSKDGNTTYVVFQTINRAKPDEDRLRVAVMRKESEKWCFSWIDECSRKSFEELSE